MSTFEIVMTVIASIGVTALVSFVVETWQWHKIVGKRDMDEVVAPPGFK